MIKKIGTSLIAFLFVVAAEFFNISHNSFFCRFESLDQEMNSLMGRILDVNQIVQQLLDGGHPSSTEVRSCQDHLNSRYRY